MVRTPPARRIVEFVDTSVLLELLQVPGEAQRPDEVRSELRDRLRRRQDLVLPTAAVIETGKRPKRSLPGSTVRREGRAISDDDGDGWTRCALGHDHWGRFGAAGLLLWHDGSVLLQHRSRWSHHGGTWGVMGGARNRGETAAEAAQREADEESGLDAAAYSVVAEHLDDHGGWAYTTVVARALSPALPRMLSWETVELRWVPADKVTTMPLHPGFAETWQTVRALGIS